ncbi:MAG TPA: DNA-3-methyladenine glycosylase [Pseudobdellovibrionaceae bacterium]|jgi:DNA-3-methyladenine glycosylase
MILDQEFFFQKTESVAKQVLGKVLCFENRNGQILSGRIVETEAYLGICDPACHSFGNRKTERTKTLYLPGGYSYIYLIYGMYYCLNFVTREENIPEAVLIRALQPVEISEGNLSKKNLLTNGPGKLCRYLGITSKENAIPLWRKNSRLWVEDDGFAMKPRSIITTVRVGIDYAKEAAQWPLRFYLKGNLWVSRP